MHRKVSCDPIWLICLFDATENNNWRCLLTVVHYVSDVELALVFSTDYNLDMLFLICFNVLRSAYTIRV
jgi:hypothetical protein